MPSDRELGPVHFAVAGFSLGGIVALEMIALATERVTLLALISSKASPTPPAQQTARLEALHLAEEVDLDAYFRMLLPLYLHEINEADPRLRQVIRDMAMGQGVKVLRRQTLANNNRADSQKRLARIRVPTLAVYGEADVLCTPDEQQNMARRVPGADVVGIAKAGHFVSLEQPAATSEVLRRLLATLARPDDRVARLENHDLADVSCCRQAWSC